MTEKQTLLDDFYDASSRRRSAIKQFGYGVALTAASYLTADTQGFLDLSNFIEPKNFLEALLVGDVDLTPYHEAGKLAGAFMAGAAVRNFVRAKRDRQNTAYDLNQLRKSEAGLKL